VTQRSLEPPYGEHDAAGMAARITSQPDQIELAVALMAASPWQLAVDSPSLLACGGLGGSAIAGELTAALHQDRLPRPLLVVRDYHWPACVDRDALALLCSYSGETEETLSLYEEAGAHAIPRVAITTGGRLAEWCRRDRVPCTIIPGGSPPRAALFSSWVTLTSLLHALGWIPDETQAWQEAAAVMRERNRELAPEVPESRNPAKQMARSLAGRFVFVYAGAERVGAVATRLRQQLNENAKMPAHSAVVPELNHNEIVGWEHTGALPKSVAVLLLRDARIPRRRARG
jgi:glucose/mannose-6-phosphate isomerase